MAIEKAYELPYDPDTVYAAWTSSSTVIPPATRMDIDPVVGGHYRLFIESGEFTGSNEGRFLMVEPGRHVVYTWEWNRDGEVTEIDVRFSAAGAGCRVDIRHDGFVNADSEANHDSGWDSYMAGLRAHLGAGAG